ncbi:MAG: response regulator transcription factor [Alphaproteobacteria bacterium]|jgi:DNA-binding NarL/FixJ family response regulator|nr:response regulator transcription factor [Alphaproteobacteria bacterium]MDP6516927.1 response regulator transcription factor [Alphaproteobacteria bacterium]|tara:strand:+ start:49 stop:741 length:693 start_codon:yes stop_codon:yes gene_type:complete
MKLLIADDHPVFRTGIKRLLAGYGEDGAVLEAPSYGEAMALCERESDLDLVLLDLNMPGVEPFTGIEDIVRVTSGVPVVVISASERLADVRAALDRGARGYIPKSSPPEVVIAAIRLVQAGGIYLPPEVLRARDAEAESGDDMARAGRSGRATAESLLTMRQLEVLRLLATGKSNKRIAIELGVTEGTVKIHVSTIFRKLDVGGRMEAVARAIELDLIPPRSQIRSGSGD